MLQAFNTVDDILHLLVTDEKSPLKEFIEFIPSNDPEYLQHWFNYLKYKRPDANLLQNLVLNYSNGFDVFVDNVINFTKVEQAINELMEKSVEDRIRTLNFKPRLEEYLDTYPEEEKKYVRMIILGILNYIRKDNLRLKNLTDLIEDYDVPETFIFTLNRNHRLCLDGIVVHETESILTKNFVHKDLISSPLLYNILASLPIPEEMRPDLAEIGLAGFFKLIDPAEIKHTDYSINGDYEMDEDETGDESGPGAGIEEILLKLGVPDEKGLPGIFERSTEEESLEDEDSLKPFKSDIEYIHAEYEHFVVLHKYMEEKNNEYVYDRDDKARKIRDLRLMIRNLRNTIDARLKKSKEIGFVPKIEQLSRRMRLSIPEKKILTMLVTTQTFTDSSTNVRVGDVLKLAEENPLKSMELRKYFRKDAKLIKSGLINIESNYRVGESFSNLQVHIDNRLVELLAGESLDISNYITGSNLYISRIKMKNVILPPESKEKVLQTVKSFHKYLKAKEKLKYEESINYGNAMVMLFVGPSGTGKTMLANAISNHLNKKILVVDLKNLPQLDSYLSQSNSSAIFNTLFREARMNNAIIFFDESELLLRERLNDLLIEIEKHDDIVIFATNASFRIDEAMRRRINLIINFSDPGPRLRKEIWRIHLFEFPQKMKLSKDVNLDELARKFEISGGLIKNAVFAALGEAVSESSSDEPVIKMKHLLSGAKDQLSNKLFMSSLQDDKIPRKGLDDIIVSQETMNQIRDIIHFEKARKVLESQWGFAETFPDNNGLAVLFYGPPGTGKTLAAEAIAYETGKTLKYVNYAQVLSKYIGETEKALEALFKDVASHESILFFDEADALFSKRIADGTANARYINIEVDILLRQIERNNVFAILTTNFIQNIDQAFLRRMRYIVEFGNPGIDLRIRLWKLLIPEKLPVADDVDFDVLSRMYEFTGGDIKNIIIRAAVNKALNFSEDVRISMQDLLDTCKVYNEIMLDSKHRKIGFGV